MEDTLISFETAKLAKEKGFKIPVINFINHHNIYNTNTIGHYSGYVLTNFNSKSEQPDIFSETNRYSAPTQSLLQKWLREKHTIHVNCIPNFKTTWSQYHLEIVFKNNKKEVDMIVIKEASSTVINKLFESYEEALEAGLHEALKLVKTN